MVRGQITFDFLIALSALALLFVALLSLIQFQNQQASQQASRVIMERTCEIISQKLTLAKLNGDGAVETFYSKLPLTSNGAAREIQIGENYLCTTPEEFSSALSQDDGAFIIENRNNKLTIYKQQ